MTWRFVVTEFGWEYTWNNNDGFGINIPNAEYSYEEDSSYKEKDDYSLKSNPVRFNNTIEVLSTYQNGDEFTSNFKLVELIRGEKANALVADANMFNDSPKEGYEYLMAKFSVEVLDGTNSSVQFMQNKYDFALISEGGEEYDYTSVVSPQPEFDVKLNTGSSYDGYIVFEVRKTDKKPLISNGRSSDGSGGVWYQAFTRDDSEYVEVVSEESQDSTHDTTSTISDETNDASSTTSNEPNDASSTTSDESDDVYVKEKKEYSSDEFDAGIFKYEFVLISNNSVGNEWGCWLSHNGDMIGLFTDVVDVQFEGGFAEFEAVVYESDDSKSDFGTANILIPEEVFINRTTNTYEVLVTIVENGGRFKGNRATVKFYLTVFPF